MEAGRVGDVNDTRPRRVDGHATRLLPVVALYGANASGKSNVLAALRFMHDAVLFSHRMWAPEGGVPRDPFAWGDARTQPSLFEITMLVGGIRYQYGFVVDDEQFLEEWLYAFPRGRKQTWFVREGQTFKFGDHLQGENRLVEQVTRPNALFLSAAVQHRHEQLWPIYAWFLHFLVDEAAAGRRRAAPHVSRALLHMLGVDEAPRQRLLFEDEETAAEGSAPFLALVRAADVGIVDLKLAEDMASAAGSDRRRRQVMVRHQSTTNDAWLPLDQESHGTLTLFRLGPELIHALRRGHIVVIDELESSLHPLLGQRIVELFNNPDSNPRNAQLVFTTHDTNLLGTMTGAPALRRDQVWLTEKDRDGATCLYPLTDFKPRSAENLERGYLQGRYGAIPFLGEFAHVEAAADDVE